jgi:hypothetical protein
MENLWIFVDFRGAGPLQRFKLLSAVRTVVLVKKGALLRWEVGVSPRLALLDHLVNKPDGALEVLTEPVVIWGCLL